MEKEYKKIYPYYIKRKITGFILFFILGILIYFISLSNNKVPVIISFILICLLYIIRIFSNFIYASYLYKFSEIKESNIPIEAKGFSLFGLLSFPIIIITGLLMNLLLSSPNYSAGFVQIFLLFSFFIFFNEFFSIYRLIKVQKFIKEGDYTKIKEQNPIGFIISIILENIGAIFTLVAVALRFEFPVNIFSLLILFGIVIITGYLFYRLFRNKIK